MSTESPKTWFFWSGNALPDPPCYDQFTDDDGGGDDDGDNGDGGDDDGDNGDGGGDDGDDDGGNGNQLWLVVIGAWSFGQYVRTLAGEKMKMMMMIKMIKRMIVMMMLLIKMMILMIKMIMIVMMVTSCDIIGVWIFGQWDHCTIYIST